MWPRFETMIPIARPFASAIATMLYTPAPAMIATAPAPPPMKMSVKVPMNSATPRRSGLSSMRPDCGATVGRRGVASLRGWQTRNRRRASRSSVRTATSSSTPRSCRGRAASAASSARTASSSSRTTASPSRRWRATATPLADRVPERLRLGQVLELLQRVVLDLADALARDAEGAPDFLERLRRAAVQAEAERDHVPLALGQRHQRVLDVLAAE